MRTLALTFITLLSLTASGQNDRVYRAQVFSVVDSLPLTGFSLRVNDELLKTDSSGFVFFTSPKSRIKFFAHFSHYTYNKIRLVKRSNGIIKLYCVKTYDSTAAVYDIQQGAIWLFCGAGFAPRAMMEWDTEFEKKYSLHYYVIGDFLPFPLNDMVCYNHVMAAFLDKKYGTGWRTEMRPDTVGLTNRTPSLTE